MNSTNVETIYEQHIKPLSEAEKLQLVALIAQKLAAMSSKVPKRRSLLELEGLGAEMWHGIDAQQYVDELREEWGHRP
jgi:hypothetical protein